MIEKIKETDIWEKLKQATLPVVLYGMGNGADKILRQFELKGIKCSGVFASDEFVRGHSFRGFKVKKYSEIEEEFGDFIVVVAFASERKEVVERIFQMRKKHLVLAPDVPVAGIELFSRRFVEINDEKFEKAYSLLIDERSKENYINIINFKIGGDINYLLPFYEKEKVYSDLLKLEGETIVDLGAYNGDTVAEFVSADKNYKKIFAVEPDEKNFKKLLKNTEDLRDIEAYNLGAWECESRAFFSAESSRNSAMSVKGKEVKLNSVDNIIGEPITLLKMDIEGSEKRAIRGARNTIKSYRPKLYICAYHRSEDLFALPLEIVKICPDYRFYFVHHRYIPAWESNFYGVCIPNNTDELQEKI